MDRNNKNNKGVTCHFYGNFVKKFSFVLSTNMAAMQTTYTPLNSIFLGRFYCQEQNKAIFSGQTYISLTVFISRIELQCSDFGKRDSVIFFNDRNITEINNNTGI